MVATNRRNSKIGLITLYEKSFDRADKILFFSLRSQINDRISVHRNFTVKFRCVDSVMFVCDFVKSKFVCCFVFKQSKEAKSISKEI